MPARSEEAIVLRFVHIKPRRQKLKKFEERRLYLGGVDIDCAKRKTEQRAIVDRFSSEGSNRNNLSSPP